MKNSLFKDKVIEIVRMVPSGKVVSYGQVALYVGLPRAAREVGWVLKGTKEDIPWWRVLNNSGRISIEGNIDVDKTDQKHLLEAEGIVVGEDYILDMEKYRYILPPDKLKQFQLSPEYIEKIVEKYGI